MNVSFSDDTICHLADWLLSSAPTYNQASIATQLRCDVGLLVRLVQEDSSFRDWLGRQNDLGSLAGQLNQPVSISGSRNYDSKKLVCSLIADTSWSVQPDQWHSGHFQLLHFNSTGRDQLEWRLWQILQLSCQIHALQEAFEQALDKQRQSMLYHIAYGLSHEINNPLANIATRANLLASEETASHRRQMLSSIVDQSMRASEMIADMMLVARPPQFEFQHVSFRQFLDEIIAQAKPWAQTMDVELTQDFPDLPSDACIRADRSALKESLWCVIRNAIEAAFFSVTASHGTHQTAGTSGKVVCALRIAIAEGGNYITVEVQDNGSGLTDEALRNCLNPYYCGREAGRGLGLGLAKVARIVGLHNGEFHIANRPSGGCTATISLPLIDD